MVAIFLIIIAILLIYLLYRNRKVCLFRTQLIHLAYIRIIEEYKKYYSNYYYRKTIKNLKDFQDDIWHIIERYSYLKMLFSFKKLNINNWFTPEEVNKILGIEK